MSLFSGAANPSDEPSQSTPSQAVPDEKEAEGREMHLCSPDMSKKFRTTHLTFFFLIMSFTFFRCSDMLTPLYRVGLD
jgi:hypothetical protein